MDRQHSCGHAQASQVDGFNSSSYVYTSCMHICCVCTGNTCRSPMLACLLQQKASEAGLEIEVSSAGVAAGSGQAASANSATCMQERGLDLSQHRSTPIHELDLNTIDQFYCMSEHHAFALYDAGIPQEKLFIVNAKNGGVPDPYGGPLSVYQETAAVLADAASDIVHALQNQDPDE